MTDDDVPPTNPLQRPAAARRAEPSGADRAAPLAEPSGPDPDAPLAEPSGADPDAPHPPPGRDVDSNADPTPARPRRSQGPVQYKGDDLEAERGPGLGCFRFQVVVLLVLIVLTPLSVVWNWPPSVSAVLLFAVILLLLVTGQTIIFLLRLVAADRRGRRRPLGSATKTVGELEDEAARPGSVEAPADPAGNGKPSDPA